MYSHENGAKENCFGVVGLCRVSDGSPKWKPINDDDDGFDPDRYIPQPTVMIDEKDYMDFEGAI